MLRANPLRCHQWMSAITRGPLLAALCIILCSFSTSWFLMAEAKEENHRPSWFGLGRRQPAPPSPQQPISSTGTSSNEKWCRGTNERMSVPLNRENHYRNLRDRYTNCTYVDGNLELTWLQDEDLDLSFLGLIREVTGYVLISHVDIKRIVLPSLQIIRGRRLFKLNGDEFALLTTLSKMHNLELPALRDIWEGSVGVLNNYNLCHVKTINWDEIITGPNASYVYAYDFPDPERKCTPCHESCEAGCWGEGPGNCQEMSSVKNCPDNLLKNKGRCVRFCANNMKAVNGECVPCDGPCPKICQGNVVVHSGNIESFKDCVVIQGSLAIKGITFSGFQHIYDNFEFGKRYPGMHPNRLEVFSTLKEITGYLSVTAAHKSFHDLSCFRNLEVIGGLKLTEMSSSLYISETSLKSLGLQSLKNVSAGAITVVDNRDLCYADGVNWNSIKKSADQESMSTNNKAKEDRERDGSVCDHECSTDGCWGSGPDQCL